MHSLDRYVEIFDWLFDARLHFVIFIRVNARRTPPVFYFLSFRNAIVMKPSGAGRAVNYYITGRQVPATDVTPVATDIHLFIFQQKGSINVLMSAHQDNGRLFDSKSASGHTRPLD